MFLISAVNYGRKYSFLVWLLCVEIFGLLFLFFGVFITLFGGNFIYGFDGFYLGLSLPIVLVTIIMGGQFYLYFNFVKKKNLKPFLSSIQEYNLTISAQPDRLKCIKCGTKENLKTDKYSWRLKGQDNTILGSMKEDDENASIIPLCRKCSIGFEIWADNVSRRKKYQIIAVFMIIFSLIFMFTIEYSSIFFVMVIIAICLIRKGNKYLNFPDFNVAEYVRNERNRGIIFRPDNSSHWISHEEWLEREPAIAINELAGKKLCKNCRSPLDSGSKFCTQCGWSLI